MFWLRNKKKNWVLTLNLSPVYHGYSKEPSQGDGSFGHSKPIICFKFKQMGKKDYNFKLK